MERNTSVRRQSTDSSSPEFEFWMVRNPSFPQPHLLTADQLFVNGVLLPLHHFPHQAPSKPEPDPEPDPDPEPEPAPSSTEPAVGFSASKRWKDIFWKGEKKPLSSYQDDAEEKEKNQDLKKRTKKKERKSSSIPVTGTNASDLNINIWPFSRSHSAGNGGRGKVPAAVARKASSAPCSRSNSRGESKSKKWPSSPGRAGLHLGRNSPVWQVRRGGSVAKSSEPVVRCTEKEGAGAPKEGSGNRRSTSNNSGHAKINSVSSSGGRVRVLNLNVPLCIGYRHQLSCRSDDNNGAVAGRAHSDTNNSNGNATLFNLRTLFSKKVY